jgi:nicotinamidase-related amidase
LKQRARQVGIPTLYVNDNFGKWRSDFRQQVQRCLHDPGLGQPIVRLLEPDEDDYFVLKPKHSAFYATPLDLLLAYLKVNTLIITGIAGDICILFTASDAFMRDYHLFVPSDCVASLNSAENMRSLEQMHRILDADIRPYLELDLIAIQHPSGEDNNKSIKQAGRKAWMKPDKTNRWERYE